MKACRLSAEKSSSRVAKTLDAAVAAFHRRPLKDRYRVLMLDGVVLKRKTGAGAIRHLFVEARLHPFEQVGQRPFADGHPEDVPE